MTLTYPIAASGQDALLAPVGFARTQSAAKREAGKSVSFETEWLRPSIPQRDAWQTEVMNALSHGAAQIYETETGDPIIAISYWKPVEEAAKPVEVLPETPSTPPKEDHADDLYFRNGRTKPKRRKPADPNQLDLFGSGTSDS